MSTITSWMISFSYIIFVVSGMAILAYVARQIFFADGIQMAYGHALLWISMANPFLWTTAARCANAAAGISDGCEAECLLPLCLGMCYDLRMHVSELIELGKLHNE